MLRIKTTRKAKGVESRGFGGVVNGWGEAAVFSESFVDAFDSLNAVRYNLDS